MTKTTTAQPSDLAFVRARSENLRHPKELSIPLKESGAGVNIDIGSVARCLISEVPPRYLDLLEIATVIYVADQAVTRGTASAIKLGLEWRRSFEIVIPVRELEFWSSEETTVSLVRLLSFMMDDNYEIKFARRLNPPPTQRYFSYTAVTGSRSFDEIALFSGGLDSLGGAVQAAVERKRCVALVRHKSTSKLANRRKAIERGLKERAGKDAIEFLTATINKGGVAGSEDSQRSRSFVFGSIAAAVSQLLDIPAFSFYENGIVSFNLPSVLQVVGSKASRTTHPKTIRLMQQFLSIVAERAMTVDSPFLWLTKAEVIKVIVEAGCGHLIAPSTSCSGTRIASNEKPHCGTCVQCIGRRLAIPQPMRVSSNVRMIIGWICSMVRKTRARGASSHVLRSRPQRLSRITTRRSSTRGSVRFRWRFGTSIRMKIPQR